MVSALAFGVCGFAAHADTSFLFTLDSGNYPSISATTPDSYVLYTVNSYYETTEVITQQLGNTTTRSTLLFDANNLDFASKDADLTTMETIFDGTSFVDGTYAALFYNDFPERLSGIPEGAGLAGTLVISTVTPEPASLMLLGTGLAGVCAVARRRWHGAAGV